MPNLQGRLGHEFKDAALLEAALTHTSHGDGNYERLEFLGDRVLGMIVGSWLYESFPQADEGELSRRYMAMVRESALVQVAEAVSLGEHIRLGIGESLKASILADVVEAVLGAIWLDGGFEAVKGFVRREWAGLIVAKDEKDPKTKLQEWLQGRGLSLPVYEVVGEEGPDHDKMFIVKAVSQKGESLGRGRSKQAASADAADNMMKILEEGTE